MSAIEAEHRHDLAAHLYLTHLLHRVNPCYPPASWSSWPAPDAADPTVYEDFEDVLLEKGELEGEEELVQPVDRAMLGLDEEGRALAARLQSTTVTHIRKKKTSARTHLVNEMHAVLLSRIRAKVKKKGLDVTTLGDGSELTAAMALDMAAHAGKVLLWLHHHKTRTNKRSSKYVSQNWQRVLLADLCCRTPGETPQVERCEKLYARASALFNRPYRYEYDAAQYREAQGVDAPPFTVEDNLRYIEEKGSMVVEEPTPLEQLRQRKEAEEFNDRLFAEQLKLAAMARDLSYKNHDRTWRNWNLKENSYRGYKPRESNALQVRDFELRVLLKE